MRKIIILVLCLAMAFMITGCSENAVVINNTETPVMEENKGEQEETEDQQPVKEQSEELNDSDDLLEKIRGFWLNDEYDILIQITDDNRLLVGTPYSEYDSDEKIIEVKTIGERLLEIKTSADWSTKLKLNDEHSMDLLHYTGEYNTYQLMGKTLDEALNKIDEIYEMGV